MFNKTKLPAVIAASVVLAACSSDDDSSTIVIEEEVVDPVVELSAELTTKIEAAAAGEGLPAFTLPAESDLASIPQDPNNELTAEKVALGQMLYHETALSTNGVNPDTEGTWSCASCHHVAAGFKSGVLQGVAEGGSGFGLAGEGRTFFGDFDKDSADPTLVPDVQPLTSPTILNSAFQEVMLWNGQFGNVENGVVNVGIDPDILATPGTPKANNDLGFAGLEIQAIAGTGVHRMEMDEDSILATNDEYIALYDAAFPDGGDLLVNGALAIAAFERTVLATQSPFQLWLAGDSTALSEEELRGANLFFGDAGCSDCHTGPALSSPVGATEDQMFMSVGFADFDTNNPAVTGGVGEADARGRGGFTGEEADFFTFKVPPLYNLVDTTVFGHGGSFASVRDVVAYKNAGVAQKVLPEGTLDTRFVPLGLSEEQIDDLTTFLEVSLYDANLGRYVPESIPSGQCFPVNDEQAKIDLGC